MASKHTRLRDIGVIGLLLASAGAVFAGEGDVVTAEAPSIEANKAIVQSLFKAFNDGDLATRNRLVDPNQAFHSATSDRQGKGTPASTLREACPMCASLDPREITIDSMMAEGDLVTVRSTWRGKYTDVVRDVPISGKDIVVHRDPSADRELEKPERTVREAFDAARRQLEDHVRRVRGRVKAHEEPDHGRVRALDRLGGTGFIERPDGTEIYFNRASLVGVAWDDLDQGTEVRFAVEQDESGLRACSVRLVGHNHHLS